MFEMPDNTVLRLLAIGIIVTTMIILTAPVIKLAWQSTTKLTRKLGCILLLLLLLLIVAITFILLEVSHER